MGFSRQEYWSGLPFFSPEDLPDTGIEPGLLHCRQILYRKNYRKVLSSSAIHLYFWLLSFPASGFFPVSQLFASCGQSIRASASASVLPMTTQNWSPLGWIGWICLQSKGLSRVFNTTVQKHQFFGAQLSFFPNSHIHTWLLEKPQLLLDGLCWQTNVSAL